MTVPISFPLALRNSENVIYKVQKLWTFTNPLSLWFVVHYIFGNKVERRIWKRVFQENKAHQIFRKTNISYSLIRTRTCAYQGVRNVCFSENLMCFVFLKHPFWDSSFCLITVDIDTLPSYYRNSKKKKKKIVGRFYRKLDKFPYNVR